MLCPVCEEQLPNSDRICQCGYHKSSQQITDRDKIRNWVRSPKKWHARCEREKRVHGFQMKHGEVQRKPGAPLTGWSMRETAKFLRISPAKISDDLRLAEALPSSPDLRQGNRTQALESLRRSAGEETAACRPEVFGCEESLQEYLEGHWEETVLAEQWSLYSRGKVKAGEVGEMDLLARHKQEPQWLVVELKVSRSVDKAVGQLLRYMGWVKLRRAEESEKVEGCIICAEADDTLRYALACVSDISLYRYCLKDNRLDLVQESIARTRKEKAREDILRNFSQLTRKKQDEVLRELSRGEGPANLEEGAQ